MENSGSSAVDRESIESEDARSQKSHLDYTRKTYCQVTGNRWTEADLRAYTDNRIARIPIEKVISAIETVASRTATKIHSFNYFVKEILTPLDPGNRAFQKKRLEKVVRKVRENQIGKENYSSPDFVEDVKRACAREGLEFNNALLTELGR